MDRNTGNQWERSANYRQEYFAANPGPYRCTYCYKKLRSKAEIEIDHIIPASRVKERGWERNLLLFRGIFAVNDQRNLVCSCKKCNRKKGTKMGIWTIRGMLGRYKLYWSIIHAVRFCIVLILIGIVLILI